MVEDQVDHPCWLASSIPIDSHWFPSILVDSHRFISWTLERFWALLSKQEALRIPNGSLDGELSPIRSSAHLVA